MAQPSTINFLQGVNFRVSIDSKTFAELEYNCHSASLPSLSAPEASESFHGATVFLPGDRITFDPFSMTFLVDENMANYAALFTWMTQNAWSDEKKVLDITLSILDSKSNPNRQIRFQGAFPVALGGIDFTSQATDVQFVSITATFRYSQFVVV